MNGPTDANAAIWQSDQMAATWAAEAAMRERNHAAQWRFMAELLPFAAGDEFIFCDLGAGTGNLSRAILGRHQASTAILADFSREMMRAGEGEMRPFAGRFSYVEFDMSAAAWPEAIPGAVDAAVTSMCVHHLPDERKQGLFAEIFDRLVPGGWYLNYDPVRTDDAVVASTWQRVADAGDPQAARRRQHHTPAERARWRTTSGT